MKNDLPDFPGPPADGAPESLLRQLKFRELEPDWRAAILAAAAAPPVPPWYRLPLYQALVVVWLGIGLLHLATPPFPEVTPSAAPGPFPSLLPPPEEGPPWLAGTFPGEWSSFSSLPQTAIPYEN